MKNKTDEAKVYIIESPHEDDLLYDTIEGEPLSSSFDLININYDYLKVSSVRTLETAFKHITTDLRANIITKNDPENPHYILFPFIHFSMHGDTNGLYLTSGDFITWNQLRKMIQRTSKEILKTHPEVNQKISPISLSFSTCEGFNAIKMQKGIKEGLYTFLIGPTEEVYWADALVAFTVLYHQMFFKVRPLIEIVELMNKIVGKKNVFKVDLGNGVWEMTEEATRKEENKKKKI
jgi:hypothetical protein